jgi:hypothetical protein
MSSGHNTFDHSVWTGLLARHVDGAGRVDYMGFQGERPALESYLAAIAAADLAQLSRGELLALLINAYNACTVRLILDHVQGGRLPSSIRDIQSPWDLRVCRVGGEVLSLNSLEHGILRPLFKDPRVHAALNCASRSCPPLPPWAFTGDKIEEQLEDRMDAMVNSEAHVRVEAGQIKISKIFDWYKGDFVDPSFQGSAASVTDYLLRHARGELKARLQALGPSPRLAYLEYDWGLNKK